MNRKPVLFYSFARSGGTVFSNYMASALQETIFLSEIPEIFESKINTYSILYKNSPHFREYLTIHNLDIMDLKQSSEGLIEVFKGLMDHYQSGLVLRDWTYVSFVSDEVNTVNSLKSSLAYSGAEYSSWSRFALVRNPIDIWLSIGWISLDRFCTIYSRYIEEIERHGVPFYRYEDFVADPDSVLNAILSRCDLLKVKRSSFSCLNKSYSDSVGSCISGDYQLESLSRGYNKKLTVLPRRWLSRRHRESLAKNKLMKDICEVCGYSSDYESVEHETYLCHLNRKLRNKRKIAQKKLGELL